MQRLGIRLLLKVVLYNGKVENSVLFQGVYVGKNTVIKDSVIMPNPYIGDNVVVNKAIIGSDVILRDDLKLVMEKKLQLLLQKKRSQKG